MKTLYSLFACLFFVHLMMAQDIEQQLVRVDFTNNNELTQLAIIPNSVWPEKEYCFDAEKGRYIFTANGSGASDYICTTIDVMSGEILNQVGIGSFNNAQGNPTYEYHEGEERIFALVPKNTNGSGIDLNKVDPATGAYTFIKSVDESVSWNETTSSINPANNEYYLVYTLQRKIVRLKTDSGEKELEVPHDDNFFIRRIDYNSTDNSLVGLAKYNGDEYISLIDIDPQTLVVSNPRQITGMTNTITGMTQGGGMSAFDAKNHLYFQVGINGSGETKLFVINSQTAEVLYSNDFEIGPFEGPFFMVKHNIEKLIFDSKNDQLLALFRDELLPSNIEYISAESNLEIFPNPTADFISVKWNEKRVNRISVFNANGRMLFSKNIKGEVTNDRIDLRELESGCYFVLSYFNTGEAVVQQVIKFD